MKLLQRRLGVTTVMVTHDQEEALTMADRIVVMNQGVIEQVGTPTQIYREPDTLFVADFVGAMNQVPGVSKSGNRIRIGDIDFDSHDHSIAADSAIVAAIRPEDIVPHGKGAHSDGGATPSANLVDVDITDMEFLGSFWRVSISNPSLGDAEMVADMSTNVVRQMNIAIGTKITVEFPAQRLWVFPPDSSAA